MATGSHFYPRQYRQVSYQKNTLNMMTIDVTTSSFIQKSLKSTKRIKGQSHFNLKKEPEERKRLKSDKEKTTIELHEENSKVKRPRKFLYVKGFQKKPSLST